MRGSDDDEAPLPAGHGFGIIMESGPVASDLSSLFDFCRLLFDFASAAEGDGKAGPFYPSEAKEKDRGEPRWQWRGPNRGRLFRKQKPSPVPATKDDNPRRRRPMLTYHCRSHPCRVARRGHPWEATSQNRPHPSPPPVSRGRPAAATVGATEGRARAP